MPSQARLMRTTTKSTNLRFLAGVHARSEELHPSAEGSLFTAFGARQVCLVRGRRSKGVPRRAALVDDDFSAFNKMCIR
eukprot:7787857-Pyramimonas_sp.AAC.2